MGYQVQLILLDFQVKFVTQTNKQTYKKKTVFDVRFQVNSLFLFFTSICKLSRTFDQENNSTFKL